MIRAAVVVFVALTLLGLARQAVGWWRRERVRRTLGDAPVIRESRGVSLSALVTGAKQWRGLDARRRSRLRGDLILTEDRFLVLTDRGVFVDLALGGDQTLGSARCTGPGRLVLEGETGRDDGLYRFETVVDDAEEWAAALAPYVSDEGRRFASFRKATP